MLRSRAAFRRFAWGALGYTLLVILWGGFVRASGSGAGCGDHWPLCNGEVIPQSPTFQTVVEFGHRLTSGLAGIVALLLVVWAWRAFPGGSPVRRGAAVTLFFMLTEGAVGAGLVLFEMVAYNPSVGRAYWMAAHLLNTFLLLAALGLTAWWASGGAVPKWRGSGAVGAALAVALGGLLVLGASGAVTALGDTLTLGGGLDPTEEPVVAALVGLRLVHPLLACVVAALVVGTVYAVWRRGGSRRAVRIGLGVIALVLAQLWIGLVNVWLHAPIEVQLVHLLVTDLIWLGTVFFAAEALGAAEPVGVPASA